jgi:hypothetical protein
VSVIIEVTPPPCLERIEVECAVCEAPLDADLARLAVLGTNPPRFENVLLVRPCPECCGKATS